MTRSRFLESFTSKCMTGRLRNSFCVFVLEQKKNAIRELDSGDDMQIRRRLKCDEDLQRLVVYLKFDH